MNLRDYLRILRKRWKLIAGLLVVCLAVGVALTLTTTKKYEATAQIFVSTATADDPQQLAQGNTFTQARVQSYTSVATSPTVTESVVSDLGLSMTAGQLASEISADAPLNKVLINLHVTDRSPAQAALLANAVATRFGSIVEGLEQTSSRTTSPVKLTVTKPAQAPSAPVVPRRKLNLALALLIGLVLGLGIAVLRELLDNTVKTPEELATQANTPVLGVVPWDKKAAQTAISFRWRRDLGHRRCNVARGKSRQDDPRANQAGARSAFECGRQAGRRDPEHGVEPPIRQLQLLLLRGLSPAAPGS